MTNRSLIGVLVCAVILAMAGSAGASTYTWVGASGSDWSVGADWSGGSIPLSGDTAIFNSFTGTITLGSSPTINTITLQGSDTLTFNGGTLNVTNFALGANDIVGGTGTITAVNLQGGTLQSGITVTSVTSTGGTIGPATIGMLSQSSGALTVTGAIGGSGTWTISGGALQAPVGGSASINHAVNVSGATSTAS